MSAWLNTYLVYDIVCSSRSYPFPGMNTSIYPYSTFSIPSSKITNLYNLQLSPFPTIANVVYMAFRATEFTYLVQPLIYLQNIGCCATLCIHQIIPMADAKIVDFSGEVVWSAKNENTDVENSAY